MTVSNHIYIYIYMYVCMYVRMYVCSAAYKISLYNKIQTKENLFKIQTYLFMERPFNQTAILLNSKVNAYALFCFFIIIIFLTSAFLFQF